VRERERDQTELKAPAGLMVGSPSSAALMRALAVTPPQEMNPSPRPTSAGQEVRVGSGVFRSTARKGCKTHGTATVPT
jgi:hypothetical protein